MTHTPTNTKRITRAFATREPDEVEEEDESLTAKVVSEVDEGAWTVANFAVEDIFPATVRISLFSVLWRVSWFFIRRGGVTRCAIISGRHVGFTWMEKKKKKS